MAQKKQEHKEPNPPIKPGQEQPVENEQTENPPEKTEAPGQTGTAPEPPPDPENQDKQQETKEMKLNRKAQKKMLKAALDALDEEDETEEEENDREEVIFKNYRYTGDTIDFFKYKGTYYTLHPGSVVQNVPANAPQVKRHIKRGVLTEV